MPLTAGSSKALTDTLFIDPTANGIRLQGNYELGTTISSDEFRTIGKIDSINDMCGQISFIQRTTGASDVSLYAFNKVNGEQKINSFMVRETAAGNPEYYLSAPAAFRNAITNNTTTGFIRSDGTLTSTLIENYYVVQWNSVNTKQENNGVSADSWPAAIQMTDSNGLRSFFVGNTIFSSGDVGSSLYAYNYNSSGTRVGSNNLTVGVTKSGDPFYSVSNTAAFRDAIQVDVWGHYYNLASEKTLTTTSSKVALSTFYGNKTSSSSNGIKISVAGMYAVSGSIYVTTDYTEGDIIRLDIYKNSDVVGRAQFRTSQINPYTNVTTPIQFLSLAANDVIYLYAVNTAGSRGKVGASAQMTRLSLWKIN